MGNFEPLNQFGAMTARRHQPTAVAACGEASKNRKKRPRFDAVSTGPIVGDNALSPDAQVLSIYSVSVEGTIMKISARVMVVVGVAIVLTQHVVAAPISYQFSPTPQFCDDPPATLLSQELGDITSGFPFIGNDEIRVDISPADLNLLPCVSDDGLANDWDVTMTNLGNVTYQDVHFVADEQVTFGNADQSAQVARHDAFRIDDVGVNASLVESGPTDGLFSPGESWRFTVANFSSPNQPSVQLTMGSGGIGVLDSTSTASIVANAVPEPNAVSLLCTLALYLLRFRRPH